MAFGFDDTNEYAGLASRPLSGHLADVTGDYEE
jgi:hypothetical protein